MLNSILNQGVQARVASKPFKQMVGQKLITFNAGSIVRRFPELGLGRPENDNIKNTNPQ